jgi:hypothetical protein
MKLTKPKLKEFRNQQFTGRVVLLDNRSFIGCSFKRCLLRYRGGTVEIKGKTEVVDCQPEFAGSAKRTVELLAIFGLLKFVPKVEI